MEPPGAWLQVSRPRLLLGGEQGRAGPARLQASPGVSAPTSSWSFLLDTQLLRQQPLTGPLA